MIRKDQVMTLILKACPSFQETWDKSDHQELLYSVMGDLAHHLLALYRKNQTSELIPLCQVIERLHTDGDNYVRELATIGFLEGIQNVWGNNNLEPEAFYKFLLPESKKWWRELNDFWAGKIHHVGEGLNNTKTK